MLAGHHRDEITPRYARQAASVVGDLFSEYGYDNTTTTQIAAAAGVSQRTFFRLFPDKPALLFEPTTPFQEVVHLVGRSGAAAPPPNMPAATS